MPEGNIDLRIIRTRKMIMEAFNDLLTKKDFKSITIKDITTEAMINRATFYHHFTDKFDLLDKVIREEIMGNFLQEISKNKELNSELIGSVFLSITKFLMSLSQRCQRSFNDMAVIVEAIIKKELESIFFQLQLEKQQNENNEKLRVVATMVSWMIYGTAIDWYHNSNESPEEYFEMAILSIKQLLTIELNNNTKIQGSHN